jgi:two-component system, sensor histidine kinase
VVTAQEKTAFGLELVRPVESGQLAFLDSLVENLPLMVFVKDARDLRFVRFNKAGEELLGIPRSEMLGRSDYDFFPREQADAFVSRDREVLEGRKMVEVPEEVIQTRKMGERILHTKKIPIIGTDGEPEYLLGISEDITEKKSREAIRLQMLREEIAFRERERSERRTAFLAEAGALMAESLDYRESLGLLAKLIVQSFCDWCSICIQKEAGAFERVVLAHRDPSKEPLLERMRKLSLAQAGPGAGLRHVLETGSSVRFSLCRKRCWKD